jgi:iron complex outermembrane receptor protein
VNRFLFLVSFLSLLASSVYAQDSFLKGVVKDAITGETLIGANVVYAEGKGVITDIDGKYSVQLPAGDYTVKVTYVGYKEQEKKVSVKGNTVLLDFELATVQLQEVQVVADIAKVRETPVAFSNITPAKIQEQLGSQDLPMVLNTTPGVYATQQGGGDGDARITIRGFNQRNVAVMIDGVPQNDMENGWVYWSNWFGLDNITRSLQVQRGLGASKLAIPSVGGSMNIITKGIDSKKGIIVKQEYGSNNALRTSIALTSGKLKNGFGITAAGSFKNSDGWVDETWSKMWFYYLKVEKKWGNHLVSLSGFGAPQSHSQRAFKNSIATYDKDYAADLGVDTTGVTEYGLRYNEHWGNVIRYRDGDSASASPGVMNERINYFHKPVIMLKDFWTVNDKFYVSAVAYASFGNGGGTSYQTPPQLLIDSNGQQNFQVVYNSNAYNPFNIYQGERRSVGIIRSSINNHQWYGGLVTMNYAIPHWEISGGVDLRSYVGNHYRTIYDLLGGDLFLDNVDKNQSTNVKRDGDIIGYHYDGKVKWGGLFAMAEFKKGRWSAFINLSGAYTGYQRIDYFRNKDLVLGDTTMLEAVGYGDTLSYNGTDYTIASKEARYSTTDQQWLPGYTVKGGANFNLTEKQSVFVNLGYLNRAPRFDNVFNRENKLIRDIKNEIVQAVELGYAMSSARLAVNFNAYYTVWNNRPVDNAVTVIIDGDPYSANVNGMDARHAGIELDFSWRILQNLTMEGMGSLGNWIWTSKDDVVIADDIGNPVDTVSFDAQGVRVGDAAQLTFAGSLRYEPIKDLYFKAQYTYFGQNFSQFEPVSLSGATAGKQSWQVPDYGLLDVHLGYGFRWQKVRFDLRGSLFNVLNTVYISDALNNDTFISPNQNFDAQSASVFMGLGIRYNTSLTLTF